MAKRKKPRVRKDRKRSKGGVQRQFTISSEVYKNIGTQPRPETEFILFAVKENGDITPYKIWENAFMGHFLIWDQLSQAILGRKNASEYLDDNFAFIRSLYNHPRMQNYHKIVLATTFDNVVVNTPHLKVLLTAMNAYIVEMGIRLRGEYFGHLASQYETLWHLAENPLGIQSVCWGIDRRSWTLDGSPETPYNVNQGKRHWSLFGEV